MQRVLVTGADGQLGRELSASAPAGELLALNREALDIGDADAVAACFESFEPQLVINAAAYTAVDRAESESALAHRVNVEGPANLARACSARNIRLFHVSTDFVFDGQSSQPCLPDAAPAPLGVYGATKLAGEQALREWLPEAVIVRTGWVYSRHGNNFVKTMLRLMGERDQLQVVEDQVGTPTWAAGLAQVLWSFVAHPEAAGVYHWSDAGVCSWYDFAVAIAEEGEALGLLARKPEIQPIPAASYPTPAQRPAYSVLDKRSARELLGKPGLHWRVQLRAMLKELKETGL